MGTQPRWVQTPVVGGEVRVSLLGLAHGGNGRGRGKGKGRRRREGGRTQHYKPFGLFHAIRVWLRVT